MNQEELVSQLAKAMCKIAEVLPRIELKAVTYLTDDMKRLVENLLASIVKFFDRAIKWYQESRVKHAVNAFWRPFRLRFQDLCDEIDDGARKVDKLAEVLMQAEVKELLGICRSLQVEQASTSNALTELKQIVLSKHSHSYRVATANNASKQRCERAIDSEHASERMLSTTDSNAIVHLCNHFSGPRNIAAVL